MIPDGVLYGVIMERKENRETLNTLQSEYNKVRSDMEEVKQMGLSTPCEICVTLELQQKLDELKQKMHKLIDEME